MLLRDNQPKYKLQSGVLTALFSLPSRYGIGSLDKEAYMFADFLKKANQNYWQLLPLVPIGKGNSPYSSTGAFAGEILYIDLDELLKKGLLDPTEIKEVDFPCNVDYKAVKSFKLPLLKKAAENFDKNNRSFKTFRKENSYWLKDYALFMAIKDYYNGADFLSWDEPLKYRIPGALKKFEEEHSQEVFFYEITQFFFYSQFQNFKNFTASIGLKLIGDIPFYVDLDSADVWAHSDCFKLGRDMTPVLVGGVPPDIFSSEGQLWGNPIYDWDYQKKNNFLWWQRRLAHNCAMYDAIRIDHFRAFADYYTIPYGSKNAMYGKWEKGMGINFWNTVKSVVSGTEIIAEDLGGDTEEVKKLIEKVGFANMKILQFAFDSDLKDPFLPKNYNRNCICYTGTHDNDTTFGWYKKATQKERLLFSKLVPADKIGSPVSRLISYGMKSRAKTVIIPLNDYLELDSDSRINIPGRQTDNWEWRFRQEDITSELIEKIKTLSRGRN